MAAAPRRPRRGRAEEYGHISRPLHVEATVSPDGTLQMRVPELTPGQHVRVSIAPEEAPQVEMRSSAEILAEMPGHHQFNTAEEVDAYINEERDSWAP